MNGYLKTLACYLLFIQIHTYITHRFYWICFKMGQRVSLKEITEKNKMNVLELKNITKRFAATVALQNVSIALQEGTIHGVCGENGAGKSTVGKIIFGIHQPDLGKIVFKGKEVSIPNPHRALNIGISESFQETYFIPELSVAENIFLVDMPMRKGLPVISWKSMCTATQELLDSLAMEIDARSPMKKLSIAETVLVSIARAIHHDSDLIVLDEPTASFNFTEVDRLFSFMRALKKRNVTTLFISHKLGEVLEISDRVTVLRDGKKIATVETDELNEEKLASMMCGRELSTYKNMQDNSQVGITLLKVEHLCGYNFKDVSFELHAGEILGIGGLMGSGKDELMRAIVDGSFRSGSIMREGKRISIRSPNDSHKIRLGYVPPDRHLQGLIPMLSVRSNMFIRNPVGKPFFVNKRREKVLSREFTDRILLKAPLGVDQVVSTLSGGNQQKVLIARILASNNDVLILHEPTRGVDVGAKKEIHRLIIELAREGRGIILCSSETEELVSLTNRVIVMRGGRIVGDFEGEAIHEEEIIKSSLQG
jgi:ABC-type sugar transport system ATPase subunit